MSLVVAGLIYTATCVASFLFAVASPDEETSVRMVAPFLVSGATASLLFILAALQGVAAVASSIV